MAQRRRSDGAGRRVSATLLNFAGVELRVLPSGSHDILSCLEGVVARVVLYRVVSIDAFVNCGPYGVKCARHPPRKVRVGPRERSSLPIGSAIDPRSSPR